MKSRFQLLHLILPLLLIEMYAQSKDITIPWKSTTLKNDGYEFVVLLGDTIVFQPCGDSASSNSIYTNSEEAFENCIPQSNLSSDVTYNSIGDCDNLYGELLLPVKTGIPGVGFVAFSINGTYWFLSSYGSDCANGLKAIVRVAETRPVTQEPTTDAGTTDPGNGALWFQLKGIEVSRCTEWDAETEFSVDSLIRMEVTQVVRNSCQCDFQESLISQGVLFCDEQELTQFIYRANIINYGYYSANELLAYIEDWVNQGPTIKSGLFILRFDPDCPVRINNISDAVCAPASISVTSTITPTLTPSEPSTLAVITVSVPIVVVVVAITIAAIILLIVCLLKQKKHKQPEMEMSQCSAYGQWRQETEMKKCDAYGPVSPKIELKQCSAYGQVGQLRELPTIPQNVDYSGAK